MKKVFWLIILSMILITSIGYCASGASVTDNGGGNKGYILINDGTGQGHRGTWTNVKDVPELKGDQGIQGVQGIQGTKGDKGDQGDKGIQGVKGDKGDQGIQGAKGDNGVNGIDGINGTDGKDGAHGLKGDQGDKGNDGLDFDPKEVTRLDNKIDTETTDRKDLDTKQSNWNTKQDNSINNLNNITANHEDRLNNQNSRISALEDTQFNIESEVIIKQGRRYKLSAYNKYNFNRNVVGEVGVRVSIALEDSWETKELLKMQDRITQLEMNSIQTETIKVSDNKYKIRIK